jgi:hypothetical protein
MGQCSKCGGETVFKSGISSKTGKPYAGHKCTVCDNFDFQRKVAPPQAAPVQPVAKPANGNIEILKLAVELAMHGDAEGKVVIESVAYFYEALKRVLSGQTAVNEGQDEEIPF